VQIGDKSSLTDIAYDIFEGAIGRKLVKTKKKEVIIKLLEIFTKSEEVVI